MNRVVVTGMGAVSPYGPGLAALREGLASGRSAVRVMAPGELKTLPGLAGRLAAPLAVEPDARRIPRQQRRSMGRLAQLAWFAAAEALEQAGLEPGSEALREAGVAFGSTLGSTSSTAQAFESYAQGRLFEESPAALFFRIMSHSAAANLAQAFGIAGPCQGASAACASGALALGLGFQALRSGSLERMLCGGAEEFHPLVAASFDLIQASSHRYNDRPDQSPRPFDADRDGTVAGEGAGAFVLETESAALGRKAPILAEIEGFASNTDGAALSHSGAESLLECLRGALDSARALPDSIGYVNAHATGTVVGDEAEAQALRRLFGTQGPLISGLKGQLGHTLGASGALETVATIDMMRGEYVEPTRNLDRPDPACEGLRLARGGRIEHRFERCLKNSFAFGGINNVLVLKRYRA